CAFKSYSEMPRRSRYRNLSRSESLEIVTQVPESFSSCSISYLESAIVYTDMPFRYPVRSSTDPKIFLPSPDQQKGQKTECASGGDIMVAGGVGCLVASMNPQPVEMDTAA